MAVLIRRGLQKAYPRQMPALSGAPEVHQIVLVVRVISAADHGDGAGRKMVRVGVGRVVLERLVMRNVVRHAGTPDVQMRCIADGSPIGISRGRSEAALEFKGIIVIPPR